MKHKIIRLGTELTDKITGIKGRVSHLHIGLTGTHLYSFAPAGFDKDTGKLADPHWIAPDRLSAGETESVDLPTEVLNTKVTHKFHRIKGTVINLIYYINGCVHFEVQPSGSLKGGNLRPLLCDDQREFVGPAITALSKVQEDDSRRKTPSPSPRPSGSALG